MCQEGSKGGSEKRCQELSGLLLFGFVFFVFFLVSGEALRILCLNTWITWCAVPISYCLCVLLEQAIVNTLLAETGRC